MTHLAMLLLLWQVNVPPGALGVCAVSIRCPRCSYKLLWHALRNNSASTWLGSLWTMTHCPSCAWPASGEGHRNAQNECDRSRSVDVVRAIAQGL
jgi:hypothetical protein